MFILSKTSGNRFISARSLGEFATAAEAIAKAEDLGAVLIDEDSDYPGCYDIITKSGDILKIEPKGFSL